MDALFRPFTFKGLQLKNRIVMAPMSRYMAIDGIPGSANAAYYRRRARNDVGLILSEGTAIARPASRNNPGIPFFHGPQALEGWQGIIAAVHAAGGKMGPQLWHTGSFRKLDWDTPEPVESPSGLVSPGIHRGVAMSETDIEATIAAYAAGAADAKRLGFDIVEVHAAHGYLIDQFFWADTNLRTDDWGGRTLAERSRFALEILKAMRAAVGPDFPIIIRLSQWKQQDYGYRLARTPREMELWLGPLADAGADFFHCSQRRFWDAEFPEVDGPDGLNFAGWAKKLTGKKAISVGSVGLSGEFIDSLLKGNTSSAAPIDQLVRRIERDEFDLMAVGRALLSDPEWVTKVQRGAWSDLRGYNPKDRSVLY
ncbi:NADH:flavin oxidoreductase [Aquamicrobium sp. LC103]|uniref:NADH:flavin oxidoreductase n=1 Tax=Aquamicrobium sp. LC103 TaxID=1120658 RepID=UPI00063E8F5F|nr:NADH:flavin oxidoreductase [Aquamicrobium sp. LC103]TKT69795.1 NADH:flavin oxidoreductase [Aquamicrobium sp. LC103]